MNKTTSITCPNCQHSFSVEEVLAGDIEKEIKSRYLSKYKQDQELMGRQQAELQREKAMLDQMKADQEKKMQQMVEQEKLKLAEQLKKRANEEVEAQMKSLKEDNEEKARKLKEAQQKEIELLRMQQQLKNKEEEIELLVQKKLLEQRDQLSEHLRKEGQERLSLKEQEYQLKLKEMEKQLDDQRKMAEEMKRKAEQGSMQLQGEIQELALEEMLRIAFPFDRIEEVGKGVKGADAVQVVRDAMGQECGRIIYESKRTKNFANDWIEKLKADLRAQGADIAILVTEAMPKDLDRFGQKEGVWICTFQEVKALAFVLRDGLIKVNAAMLSQENKGDKMQLLYNYLTGNEFRQQIEAIVEGFVSLKNAITKERIQMEKTWKEREKQLDKVLLHATHFYGSVKGIAGNAVGNIRLLEGESDELQQDLT